MDSFIPSIDRVIFKLMSGKAYHTEKDQISGVILAGGKSKRMGVDKATITVGGELLIEYPLRILKEVFKEIMVITSNLLIDTLQKELSEHENLKFLTDIYSNHGALGGIYTAMCHATTPYIFVTACDMPFISAQFIQYMASKTTEGVYDVVIPESPGGIETLHAIYRCGLKDIIKKELFKNNNKIKTFFPKVNVFYVSLDVVRMFGDGEKMFRNINTPEELKEILS